MAGEMDCMYFITWDFDEERGMIFYEKKLIKCIPMSRHAYPKFYNI
jgi:hypothetical protein